MASTAVDLTRASRVTAYQLNSANFSSTAPNLPQRIVVIGEANFDKQTGLDITQFELTSAFQASEKYGAGSPLHQVAKILRPEFSQGVGGIPTIFIPQETTGSDPQTLTITVTGTATANKTHNLVVNGRESVDGEIYSVNIEIGDTADEIATKFGDAIANVTNAPIGLDNVATNVVSTSTKWEGITANDVNITVNTNDDDAGIVYVVAQSGAGTGTPDISDAIATFGDQWNTLIVSCYNLDATSIISALEAFNGIPLNTNPTGQYSPIIQRPFRAVFGSVDDENTTFTDAHLDDVTIALAPAPLSAGLPLEAAANMVLLYAPIAQNTPHQDVNGLTYPDMPTPLSIGTMSVYNNRDAYVKKGNSTVSLSAGKYKIEDFITTYHPAGETVPQHRYVRNFTVDSNVKFTYELKLVANVLDKVIANDDDTVAVTGIVKPKMWKADVFEIIDQLVLRGLIADPSFSKSGTIVNLSSVNPDRFETTFPYKRTGVARIVPTTVDAGFNYPTTL
jgi:phage tail sheath gpL-like